jgi:uncharacterized protein (DUF1778 family)
MEASTNVATNTKDERLNFRIRADVKERIEMAAKLSGQTVSDFITSASANAALEVINKHRSLELTEVEFARFCAALEADIAPNEAAIEAARRFNATTSEMDGIRYSR